MKGLFGRLFLLTILLIGVMGCEKTDEGDPPVEKPAEKLVKEIVDALGKKPEVSEFVSVLGQLDMSGMDVEELTVFAVKNASSKSVGGTKAGVDANSIKRHIVKGVYKISDLKDGIILISISNDSLVISVKGEEVLINQIPIETKGETVGKSVVYFVPEVIPEYKEEPVLPKNTLLVTVLACNSNWNVDQTTPGLPTLGALVKVYTKEAGGYQLLKELTTVENGLATIELEGSRDYYYTVEKEDATPFFDGYRIAGLCTTDEDLNIPINGSKPELGSLKFLDVNADAQINSDDKFSSFYIPVDFEEGKLSLEEVVYIAPPTFLYQTDRLEKQLIVIDEDFKVLQRMYREIDASLSYEVNGLNFNDRQKLDSYASSIWNLGYKLINEIVAIDQRYLSDAAPASLKEKWLSKSPHYWLICAFTYTELLGYFGGVPIIEDAGKMNARVSKEELMDYIKYKVNDRVISQGDMKQKNAANMLLARLFLFNYNYMEAFQLSSDIVRSGMNGLSVGNVFSSADNLEVIWGGFPDNSLVKKGTYSHIFRYTETLLLMSESALELGNTQEAVQILNQLCRLLNQPDLHPGLPKDELVRCVQKLWKSQMNKEGVAFGNLKRWGIFLKELGQYGAREHNIYLPIPQSAVEQAGLRQNLGY